MKLRNLATGGIFECDGELGKRILSEGGYEEVTDAPTPAPVKKAAPRKAAPSA